MLQLSIAINNRTVWHAAALNVGGTDACADYQVEVYKVERGPCGSPRATLLCEFRIEQFERALGAVELAKRILAATPV